MSDDGGKQVHEFKHMDCVKICAGSYVCTFEGDDVLNGVVWEQVTNHPNNNGYSENGYLFIPTRIGYTTKSIKEIPLDYIPTTEELLYIDEVFCYPSEK